jgi:hydrogenase expression/formation protein HypE
MDKPVIWEGLACPLPISLRDTIVLGHGSGGRMSQDLIDGLFYPAFDNPVLRQAGDAALVDQKGGERLAVSTDCHVVWPLFFPGGDIGRLAVCGTVNDVAMMGAEPVYLTAGFILEEGLPMETLARVVASMRDAAGEAGVTIIAGDTKVVQRGKGDGLYITTAGVGRVRPGLSIGPGNSRPGDAILLSGPIGDHGIAVLSARGELGLEVQVTSDVAPLNGLVSALVDACGQRVHVLRDPTRGGVASALNEIARASQVGMSLQESCIPVREPVLAACELLGFDPLYVANEGKLLAIVASEAADEALGAMRSTRYGEEAVLIGHIAEQPAGRVLMRTEIGGHRLVEMLAGEMLPRIC